MSKMGQLNFVLQEQAEELGFSTVQEALDNGYEVIQRTMGAPRDLDEIDREPEVWYELQKKDELEEAHEAWLKEKDEALTLLNKTIFRMRCATSALYKNSVPNGTIKAYAEWNEQCAKDLERVKDFIKGGEV